jgi:CMP/dCMP kinase
MSSIRPLIIAIDGPAASGKGTLARLVASEYGLAHLDTGLTYRAVAKAMLDQNMALHDEKLAVAAAIAVNLNALDRSVLSAHAIGEAASKIAVYPEVRRILVEQQRTFAKSPNGAILDGRDIGTVVCPDAPVKFFVTALPEVRAQRRYDEIIHNGGTADFETILADVKRRDERDSGRADSPLRPAPDAHLLDTSSMSIETAFQAARAIIERNLAV